MEKAAYNAATSHNASRGEHGEPGVMNAVVLQPAAPLPERVPLPLRMVVDKALEKDPADRFQSMHEMVVDLRRISRQSAELVAQPATSTRSARKRLWRTSIAAVVVVVLGVASVLVVSRFRQSAEPDRADYTQLTNFADSAVSPALSPDGRMLTFIRGDTADTAFFPRGQIYVKLLPDGEPKQLTNDTFRKFSPKFSPDGARIAYSTGNVDTPMMDTWIVPVLGGQPRRLLTNVEGLTWF
jgi:hypothetical protein